MKYVPIYKCKMCESTFRTAIVLDLETVEDAEHVLIQSHQLGRDIDFPYNSRVADHNTHQCDDGHVGLVTLIGLERIE